MMSVHDSQAVEMIACSAVKQFSLVLLFALLYSPFVTLQIGGVNPIKVHNWIQGMFSSSFRFA